MSDGHKAVVVELIGSGATFDNVQATLFHIAERLGGDVQFIPVRPGTRAVVSFEHSIDARAFGGVCDSFNRSGLVQLVKAQAAYALAA